MMADDTNVAWIASVHESAWHTAPASAGGGFLVAECGHRLRGAVHRRLGRRPPVDGDRVICAACSQAVEYATAGTIRYPWLEAAYAIFADGDRSFPRPDGDPMTKHQAA